MARRGAAGGGSIGETFGLRWQAMLGGVAFMSHQFGSFLGAFGGGLVYDMAGSYTLAWQIGVTLGLAAGIVQGGVRAGGAGEAAFAGGCG